jgi:hypothetical protein
VAATPPPPPPGLSAQQVVDQLGQSHPMPNPRDNTGSCYADGQGCLQLVTTDAVSVYQWKDEGLAKRWVDSVGKDNATRVGVFVLNYGGREQKATTAKVRKDWAGQLKDLVAAG